MQETAEHSWKYDSEELQKLQKNDVPRDWIVKRLIAKHI